MLYRVYVRFYSDYFYCGSGVPSYNALTASSGLVDIRFVSGAGISNGDSGFELHYNVYHTGGQC